MKIHPETFTIKHNYDLFQKIHEWYFDTQGLIKNKLAIDINILS